ncbi:hypothetical protein O988_09020 [Pseudogymnoascus sp. VKM F-3808]|nr:hypothetical protein O988_09020 [Pseudogymnoascus sp. VKM F-3808]
MTSFCWIRPLQVGHGIRRSYQSRAPFRTAYLKSRHPHNSLSYPTHHHDSTSRPPSLRYISSSSSPTLPEPENSIDETAQNIRAYLRHLKHDKWGWVIYRCSYANDEDWTRFQQIINEKSRQDMAERGFPPDVVKSLEWTFISDPTLFNNASRDQLRRHFHAWVTEAQKSEHSLFAYNESKNWGTSQRYTYFIQVDESALRSVVDADPDDILDEGWVNLVRCSDEDLDLEMRERERGNVDEEDGDEGWMMIAAHMVGADFYDVMGGGPDAFYTFYQPPPGLVVY